MRSHGGGAGIDAASSAQSRRVGTGVECGGTELEGGEASDRGSKTAAGGDSDMSAVVEDGGNGKTACLRPGWGGLGYKGGDGDVIPSRLNEQPNKQTLG